MILALISAATASCTLPDVLVELGGAESAFSSLDPDALSADVSALQTDLACLPTPITPEVAARVHRAFGLGAFSAGRTDAAAAAFAAARAADPSYTFPASIVPEGHPVRTLWTARSTERVTPLAVTVGPYAEVRIDGVPATARPADLPVVVQWLDTRGAVGAGGYYWAEDPLPVFAPPPKPVAITPAPAPHPVSVAKVQHKGPNVPLTVVTGVSLVASGLLFGAAYDARQTFYDEDTADADLPRLQARTNGFWGGAIGAAGVALGCGVGAVLLGSW